MVHALTSVPRFLRRPAALFESVGRGEDIGDRIRAFSVSSVLFLATYGFVTGLSHSLAQAAASAVKMPILFVATILFCLPAYYFFSLVLGSRLVPGQVITIVLAAISVTAFLLLGLSPVTLFFVLTSRSYPFFQLLAVVFVGLSGCVGLYFLWRGMSWVDNPMEDGRAGLRRALLGMWFVLFAFVASQMTWRLSPFVGDPERPFVLLEPSRDNFYVDVLKALLCLLGIEPWLGIGSVLGIAGLCALPLLALVFGIGVAADSVRRRRVPGVSQEAANVRRAAGAVSPSGVSPTR